VVQRAQAGRNSRNPGRCGARTQESGASMRAQQWCSGEKRKTAVICEKNARKNKRVKTRAKAAELYISIYMAAQDQQSSIYDPGGECGIQKESRQERV